MTDLFDIFFVQMLIYLMQFKTSLLNKSVKLYRILWHQPVWTILYIIIFYFIFPESNEKPSLISLKSKKNSCV